MAAGIISAGLSQMVSGTVTPTNELSGNKNKVFDITALHNHYLVWGSDPDDYLEKVELSQVSIPNFEIEVVTLTGNKTIVNVNDQTTIYEMKLKVERLTNIPTDQQRLVCKGIELVEENTISYYSITKESRVNLILRLRGGELVQYTLDEDILDSSFDFIYPLSDTSKFTRGGHKFERPNGWEKKAIKVLGLYGSDDWLGVSGSNSRVESVPNEWVVSYHGTAKNAAKQIGKNGYDLSKGNRFIYGKGIYSTPTPKIAEAYALEFDYVGRKYKMMMMNRVNMAETRVVDVPGIGKYFITSNENNIRPYSFLIKTV